MPIHSPLSALALTAFLLLLPLASAAFDSCYFPNGSLALDYNWKPCYSSSTVHSPCCIPDEGDVCQSDGLCYYAPNNHVFRGACTDPTFSDPACPQLCTSGAAFDTWVWIQKCLGAADDGNYKCGGLENDGHQWATCATPDPSWSVQTRSTSLSPPTATTTRTTTTAKPTQITVTVRPAVMTTAVGRTVTGTIGSAMGTGSTGTPAAATGTDTGTPAAATGTDTGKASAIVVSDAKSGLSTGAIVGIAIGGAAVLAIAAAGIWFCLRRKKAAVVEGPAPPPGQPGELAPGVVAAGRFYAPEKVGGAANAVEIGGSTTAYAQQTHKFYQPQPQPATSTQPTVPELHSPGFVQQQFAAGTPPNELPSPEFVPGNGQQQYAAGTPPNELPSPGFVPRDGQQFAVELEGSGVRR